MELGRSARTTMRPLWSYRVDAANTPAADIAEGPSRAIIGHPPRHLVALARSLTDRSSDERFGTISFAETLLSSHQGAPRECPKDNLCELANGGGNSAKTPAIPVNAAFDQGCWRRRPGSSTAAASSFAPIARAPSSPRTGISLKWKSATSVSSRSAGQPSASCCDRVVVKMTP